MSSGDKLILAKPSAVAVRKYSPVWCADERPITKPGRAKRFLHIEGFGGGVPLNTETAAVKPRVGIEQITKRCLFFVEIKKSRAPACAAESPKLSLPGAAPGRLAN